jgi:hypothetical protein
MSNLRLALTSRLTNRLDLAALLLTLLLTAGATAAFWQTTRWGVGLRGDSLAYFGGARNLLAGNGYTRTTGGYEQVPITHFPPLYAASLAASGLVLDLDPLPAARTLHAGLFAAGVFLTGLAFAAMAQRLVLAPLGALLFAADHVFFELFAWGMSEALYLVLVLGSLLTLAAYLRHPSRSALIAASVLLALLYLTRYAGLSLLPVALLALLVVSTGRRSDRVSLAILLGIVLLPAAALSLLNSLATGTPVNRGLIWHPPAIGDLRLAVRGVWEWLLPTKFLAGRDPERPPYVWAFLALLGSLLALIGLLLARARRLAARGSGLPFVHGLSLLAALHIVSYAGVLLINLTVVDASTPLDHRILSPIYLSLLLLIGAGFALLLRSNWPARHALALLLALPLALVAVDDVVDVARQIHAKGLGFSSVPWVESPTLQAIAEFPDVPILTDQPDLVYLRTGRPAFIVFTRIDPVTGLPRPGYDAWLASAREKMCTEDARLVFFHPDLLAYGAADSDMVERMTEGMRLEQSYSDGAVYRCDGAPSP